MFDSCFGLTFPYELRSGVTFLEFFEVFGSLLEFILLMALRVSNPEFYSLKVPVLKWNEWSFVGIRLIMFFIVALSETVKFSTYSFVEDSN